MLTQNEAGTLLPPQRPDIDAILSAIAHLQLAAEALDAQRLHIDHIPTGRRERIERRLGESHRTAFELYDTACELVAQILLPELVPQE